MRPSRTLGILLAAGALSATLASVLLISIIVVPTRAADLATPRQRFGNPQKAETPPNSHPAKPLAEQPQPNPQPPVKPQVAPAEKPDQADSAKATASATATASSATAALSPESQKIYDTSVKPFLATNCVKCHNDEKTMKNFRIDNLGTDFLFLKTGDNWNEIRDKILLDNRPGAMPPAKERRPDPKEAVAVAEWILQELNNAEKRKKHSTGLTRRMNRTEYFNTLRDLFYLDENYVRGLEDEWLPDEKADGFDRSGTALFVDQAQLAKYVDMADRVLSAAVFNPPPKISSPAIDYARDMKDPETADKLTKLGVIYGEVFNTAESPIVRTGATWYEFKNGGIEYLAASSPHRSNILLTWGYRSSDFLSKVNQPGWYRLKFRAGAFAGKGENAVEDVKVDFMFGKSTGSGLPGADWASVTKIIDAPLDAPRDYVIDIYLDPKPDVLGGNGYLLQWNGMVCRNTNEKGKAAGPVIMAPEVVQFQKELRDEHYRLVSEAKRKGTPDEKIDELVEAHRLEANTKNAKFMQEYAEAKKPKFVYNPEIDLQSIPRLWLESGTIEGPIVEWPPKGREKLLLAGEQRPIDDRYIRDIFAGFLPRAYRRAVKPEEVDSWVTWVSETRTRYKLSGIDALQEGIKAILCSPDFLFISQFKQPTGSANNPQRLTDYELASRLSYFLWSTMPDDELFQLAAENKLHEPNTLEAQVKRMIKDPRGMGLVRNFTGQWLQVRDFYRTNTNRGYYSPFYNDELRKSSWQEPYEFFKEILSNDLSILNFVDSNFLVIDKTLAKHYGMKEVMRGGEGFQRVAIRPEDHRGGVLGMAGVLTYLTDGCRTLPVRRAAYVMDVMWNEPPKPPPPNAGDLPKLTGNLTVRQRLDMHRKSPLCASCHVGLDPFGMALENYDAIGRWREHQNGVEYGRYGVENKNSPPLDVSGMLPSGRTFKNLAEYKQMLAGPEKDRFIRGFTVKMLTYALGRSVGATDRETVDGIIKTLERDNYRMQSLVQGIVASEAFRMK